MILVSFRSVRVVDIALQGIEPYVRIGIRGQLVEDKKTYLFDICFRDTSIRRCFGTVFELFANGEQETEVRFVRFRIGRNHLRHTMRERGRKFTRQFLHDEAVF